MAEKNGGAQKRRTKAAPVVEPITVADIQPLPQKKRQGIRKSVRFEVFKRDLFACRYCGMTPPDALLVIDHIIPVAEGGTNDIDNLVTSCSACNTGKGTRLLDAPPPPTDSLQRRSGLAQERLELELALEEFVALEAAMANAAETLIAIASQHSDRKWNLPLRFAYGMLRGHDFTIVAESVSIAAGKIADGVVDKYEGIKYAWGVIKNKESGNG